MSQVTTDKETGEGLRAEAARVLLVAEEGAGDGALRERLAAAGFAADCASPDEASSRAAEVAPAAVLLAFGEREGEGRLVALARRLRTEPSSFALPVVFLFRADNRALRSAARHLGADDYFAQDATAEEMRARLASLLWRAESGRRSAPVVADQRSEIDNFLFLLDAVGADARAGATGSLALVEAEGVGEGARDGDDSHARSATLAGAHGFLKLNLRRVDAVAFYGPATLLVYLHGADAASARATLTRLREEFAESSRGRDLFVGISSFPAHGSEVERLVEQAEVALNDARGENSAARVVVYGFAESGIATHDAERRMQRQRMTTAGNEPTPFAATQASVLRAGGKLRRVMLVVSDAARMAQVNLLMRSAAYEVRAAFDGQHALNLLRIDRPDALVVDYELPGFDGIEMLRRLAKQSRSGEVPPALLLLPSSREDLRADALAAGARGVIGMPYDAVELLERLRELCERE
ncbi:MAG: two-component system, OmpR family, response regulator [Acidobacteriota bacterium]|nr:two-component system, OmpR family, response regulator [Acidobacteriota bacterium]